MAFLSVEPLLEDLGQINLSAIGWVIVGGESGRGARPMLREWVMNIQAQCRAPDVPFFFNQGGGVRAERRWHRLHCMTWIVLVLVGGALARYARHRACLRVPVTRGFWLTKCLSLTVLASGSPGALGAGRQGPWSGPEKTFMYFWLLGAVAATFLLLFIVARQYRQARTRIEQVDRILDELDEMADRPD